MMRLRIPIPGLCGALLVAAALSASLPARAMDVQDPVDQADPAIAGEQIEAERAPSPSDDAPLPAVRAAAPGMTSAAAIVAGAIRVEGATVLPPATFAPAIEPYLGRPLGPEDLQALARDVAEAARRAGYGLATAWIPQQDLVAGVLRVTLDEGRVDAIEVDGPGREAVERRLAPLATGRPLRTAALERALLLAGDLPGISMGQARIVRRNGRNFLVISAGRDRVRGRAGIDNSGSATVGPVRAQLGVDISGLLARDDRLSLGGVVTPLQPRELQFVYGSYTAALGRDGTEASLRGSIGNTQAGASLRDDDIDGMSREVEAGVTHPILRSRAASLWGSVALTLRDSNLDRAGTRIRDDRIVTTSAGLYGVSRLGGGWLRVRMRYVQGLDWLGATERGDTLASRADAGGPFSKFEFWMRYNRALNDHLSIDLTGQGQLASRPLLASEEMGLGGRQFVRAFDYREMAGDEGAAGAAELRYDIWRELPAPLQRLQFYLYVDGGRVTNLNGGLGGGSLASAGGGVRLWARNGFEAGLELGLPLTDGAFDAAPDPRVFFFLGRRF